MKDFKKKIAEIEKINQAAKSNYNADKFIRLLIVIAILIVYVLIVTREISSRTTRKW